MINQIQELDIQASKHFFIADLANRVIYDDISHASEGTLRVVMRSIDEAPYASHWNNALDAAKHLNKIKSFNIFFNRTTGTEVDFVPNFKVCEMCSTLRVYEHQTLEDIQKAKNEELDIRFRKIVNYLASRESQPNTLDESAIKQLEKLVNIE